MLFITQADDRAVKAALTIAIHSARPASSRRRLPPNTDVPLAPNSFWERPAPCNSVALPRPHSSIPSCTQTIPQAQRKQQVAGVGPTPVRARRFRSGAQAWRAHRGKMLFITQARRSRGEGGVNNRDPLRATGIEPMPATSEHRCSPRSKLLLGTPRSLQLRCPPSPPFLGPKLHSNHPSGSKEAAGSRRRPDAGARAKIPIGHQSSARASWEDAVHHAGRRSRG